MIMATRMTINGASTCTEAGTEKYERFQLGIGRRKRTLVQYDYRHPTNGEGRMKRKKKVSRSVRMCEPSTSASAMMMTLW